jgi:hypothetical protein
MPTLQSLERRHGLIFIFTDSASIDSTTYISKIFEENQAKYRKINIACFHSLTESTSKIVIVSQTLVSCNPRYMGG